jgi:hypothetical protein
LPELRSRQAEAQEILSFMMHSNVFRVVGAILVALAMLAFLFRGTFNRSAVPLQPAVPPPAAR